MKKWSPFIVSIIFLVGVAHAEVVQGTKTTSKETKLKDSKVLIQTSINFTTESLACTWAYPAAQQEATKRHYHQCAAPTCTIKNEGPENFAVTGSIICLDESARSNDPSVTSKSGKPSAPPGLASDQVPTSDGNPEAAPAK